MIQSSELSNNSPCSLESNVGIRTSRTRRQIVHSLLVLHHKGHLLHGDIEFDFRHIHINENDKAIRIIDFDHSASHKCSQTGEIEMYNYQPSRSIFTCGELYHAFCRIGAWTPGTHDIFARCAKFQHIASGRPHPLCRTPNSGFPHAHCETPHEDAQSLLSEVERTDIESKAQRVLDLYYRMYGPRFKTIGHPLQLKLPNGIPEVPDSEDEDEDAKMPPFQKPEWKPVTFEHA